MADKTQTTRNPAPQIFGLVARSTGTYSYAFVALACLLLVGLAFAGWLRHLLRKSPRLLLLISYVAIAINIITMIIGIIQGASIFSYLLGFVIPGVIVFLLLNPQSKQYYAARGINY